MGLNIFCYGVYNIYQQKIWKRCAHEFWQKWFIYHDVRESNRYENFSLKKHSKLVILEIIRDILVLNNFASVCPRVIILSALLQNLTFIASHRHTAFLNLVLFFTQFQTFLYMHLNNIRQQNIMYWKKIPEIWLKNWIKKLVT